MAPKKSASKEPVPRALVNRQVKDILASRQEMKQFIFDQVSTSSSNAGTVFNLSQFIIQGDVVNQREGSQIYMEAARLILTTVLPSAGITGSLRVILVQDTEAHGAPPLFIDVMETATLDAAPNVVANIANRFRFLHDHTFSLTVGGMQTHHLDITKAIHRKVTYYQPTAVTTANGKNSLHLLLITDLAANTPTFTFKCLMKFRDN